MFIGTLSITTHILSQSGRICVLRLNHAPCVSWNRRNINPKFFPLTVLNIYPDIHNLLNKLQRYVGYAACIPHSGIINLRNLGQGLACIHESNRQLNRSHK